MQKRNVHWPGTKLRNWLEFNLHVNLGYRKVACVLWRWGLRVSWSDREAGHHVGSGAATKCSGDLSSTTCTECVGFSGSACRGLWAGEGRSQEPEVILDKTQRTKRPR